MVSFVFALKIYTPCYQQSISPISDVRFYWCTLMSLVDCFKGLERISMDDGQPRQARRERCFQGLAYQQGKCGERNVGVDGREGLVTVWYVSRCSLQTQTSRRPYRPPPPTHVRHSWPNDLSFRTRSTANNRIWYAFPHNNNYNKICPDLGLRRIWG